MYTAHSCAHIWSIIGAIEQHKLQKSNRTPSVLPTERTPLYHTIDINKVTRTANVSKVILCCDNGRVGIREDSVLLLKRTLWGETCLRKQDTYLSSSAGDDVAENSGGEFISGVRLYHTVALYVISLMTITGNALLTSAVTTSYHLRHKGNILLARLVVADWLVESSVISSITQQLV